MTIPTFFLIFHLACLFEKHLAARRDFHETLLLKDSPSRPALDVLLESFEDFSRIPCTHYTRSQCHSPLNNQNSRSVLCTIPVNWRFYRKSRNSAAIRHGVVDIFSGRVTSVPGDNVTGGEIALETLSLSVSNFSLNAFFVSVCLVFLSCRQEFCVC